MLRFAIVALCLASLFATSAAATAPDTVTVNKVDTVYVVKDGGAPSLSDFIEEERDTRGQMLTVIEILVAIVGLAALFAGYFSFQVRREAREEIESIRKRSDEVDALCARAKQLLQRIEEHEETAGGILADMLKRTEQRDDKYEQEALRKGLKATDIEEKLKLINGKDAEADVKYYESIRDELMKAIPTDMHKAMAWNYLRLKSYEKAEEELSICLGVNPRDGEVCFLMGWSKVVQAKYLDSLKYWEKTVAADPGNAVAYYNWGNTLGELYKADPDIKYLHEAVKKFEQAVHAAPSYAAGWYNWGVTLGELYEAKPDVTYLHEAAKKYEQAVQANPSLAVAYYNWGIALGRLYRAEKETKYLHQAVKKYEQAVQADPSLAVVYYNWGIALGDLYKEEKDIKYLHEAVKKYEQAVQADPSYVLAWYNWGATLGYLYKAEKDIKYLHEAVKKYKQAVQADPSFAAAHYNLACVYSLLGEKDKMLQYLDSAIALDGSCAADARSDQDFSAFFDDADFLRLTERPPTGDDQKPGGAGSV